MSLSRLSGVLRAGLRIESQFYALNGRQSINVFRLGVSGNNFARLTACGRSLYSTETISSDTLNAKVSQTAQLVQNDGTANNDQTLVDIEKSVSALVSGLKVLDEQVRKIGRVDINQVLYLLGQCRKGMTNEEAVMVIRCCGNLLVRETNEERSKLLEQAMKTVQTCCDAITIDMVNARLAMQIENSECFNPAEELSNIQKSGNMPDKKTFLLMMAQYCKMGDMAGANEILNHMKSMDWSVNLTAMHHLIEGYTKNGNFEEAKKLISALSQHNLRPTADTYTTLMMGYAEKGDMNGIEEVMSVVAEKGIRISLGNALDVVLKLALSGHSENVKEALDNLISSYINEYRGFNGRNSLSGKKRYDYHDSLNLIYRLVSACQFEAAVQVLKKIWSIGIVYNNAISSLSTTAIIAEMIKKRQPIEQLMAIRELLLKELLMESDLEIVANQGLKLQQPDYVIELLGELKKQGMLIKPHYTWPIFYKARVNKSTEDIYKATELVMHCPSSLSSITRSIISCSYDNLKTMGQKTEEIMSRYKEIGMTKTMRNIIEIDDLTKQGEFGKIQQLIEGGHEFSMHFIVSHLSEGIRKSNKSHELIELIKFLQDKMVFREKMNGILLKSTISTLKRNSDELKHFLQSWINNEIQFVGNSSCIREAKQKGVDEEMLKKLSALMKSTASVEFESPLLEGFNLPGLGGSTTHRGGSRGRVLENRPTNRDTTMKAKDLIIRRETKELKSFVYELSQSGDIEALVELKKLRFPRSLLNFLERSIFIAHIQKGKAKEFVKANTDSYVKNVTVNVLCELAEKDPEVFTKVEELLSKPSEDMKYLSPYASLYGYYLKINNEEKLNQLLVTHPLLKEKIFLGHICRQAKFEKNEPLLRQLIKIHKSEEFPWKVIPVYNTLLILKCEANDHQAALDAYNEALRNGLTFDNFSVRALQSLQSLLQGNNQPLPWKEGDVEKKAEKASKDGSDSGSDSD